MGPENLSGDGLLPPGFVGSKGHVQCAIACAVLRTCSWRIATIRPSLPFGAPKVLAARRDDPTRRSVTDGHDPLCGQG